MSNVDTRIMRFLSRKEAEFPELKQPSNELYQDLVRESRQENYTHSEIDIKTYKKAVRNPFSRALYTA